MSIKIIFQLLDLLNVQYTRKYILDNYSQSNNTIDLNAVTILLDYFHIDSLLVKISKDELDELDFPCLTSLEDEDGKLQYIVLTEVRDDRVEYIDHSEKKITASLSDFLDKWSMICILIDATDQKAENNYQTNKKQNRIRKNISSFTALFLCIGFLLAVSNISFAVFTLPLVSLLIIKLIGIFVTLSIISKEIGLKSKIFDNICTSGKFDCAKVVRSPNSSFLGFNLSEVGVTYFTATTILLLLTTSEQSFWQILTILSFIGLAFTFFSLYLQAFKLKSWCFLCLIVLALIWLEYLAIILFKGISLTDLSLINTQTIGISLLTLSAISLSVYYLRNSRIRLETFRNQRLKYFLFKEKIDNIDILMKNGTPLRSPNISDHLEIGSSSAEHQLTIVTHPHCKACRNKYPELREVLQTFSEYISIKVVISYDVRFIELTHYMMQYLERGEDKLGFLDFCFTKTTNLESIRKHFPIDLEQNKPDFQRWLKVNELDYTPCYILDNRIVDTDFELKHLTRYLKNVL
ncbi:MAG: vitamin K epoxide reductase family protein [Bacteroidota bacterium]